jgi:hypothetical protein
VAVKRFQNLPDHPAAVALPRVARAAVIDYEKRTAYRDPKKPIGSVAVKLGQIGIAKKASFPIDPTRHH